MAPPKLGRDYTALADDEAMLVEPEIRWISGPKSTWIVEANLAKQSKFWLAFVEEYDDRDGKISVAATGKTSLRKRVRTAAKMVIAPYRDDLNKIVILNPKGGCGKTTLATNLAAYFALRGPTPTLIDTDPRGFSARWIQRRPADRPRIEGIALKEFTLGSRRIWPFRTPKDAGAIIIDTPAALDSSKIHQLTYDADCVLIPILPSRFDIDVTTNFIAELMLITDLECPIAVVANRTRKNTRSLAKLERVLEGIDTPTIAAVRDTQTFVHAANFGIGIYEMRHHEVKQEKQQLDLIVNWLDEQLLRSVEPGLLSRFNPLRRVHGSHSAGV